MNKDKEEKKFAHEDKNKVGNEKECVSEDIITSNNCDKKGRVCKETEYLELAQRIKAEFENYKKRNAEIAEQSKISGMISVITKLLPALDGFQKAKEIIKDEDVLNGVIMIENQINKALEDLGVKKIEAVGKEFDPNFHNAVLADSNANYPDNIVLEELQTGFMLNDKVIRYSVVKVNRLS